MEPISKRVTKRQKALKKHRSDSQQIQNYLSHSYKNQNNYSVEGPAQNVVMTNVKFLDPANVAKKAKLWWNQMQANYFKSLSDKDWLLLRHLASSEKMFMIFNPQQELGLNFIEEEILKCSPSLQQTNHLKVFFKSQTPFQNCLVSFRPIIRQSRQWEKNSEQMTNKTEQNQIGKWRVLRNQNKTHRNGGIIKQLASLTQQSVGCTFQFSDLEDDEETIAKILLVQHYAHQEGSEQIQSLDTQLALWKKYKQNLALQNAILWDKLGKQLEKQLKDKKKSACPLNKQIDDIRNALMHFTILRYFEHGLRDKTRQMLTALIESLKQIRPTKTREESKKFFETDCKICFCSFNYDSNQVLYCDMCNTSFHLACYGLHRIPPDNQYFCDCCSKMKSQSKVLDHSVKKLVCQICNKANFPLKEVEGHFYHITCLMIYGLGTLQQGTLQLKEGLNHRSIVRKVVESEIEYQSCIYCSSFLGSITGMRSVCRQTDCTVNMHPICGYINGCRFEVRRNTENKKVEVQICCNGHDEGRDFIQQSYLRRYMCNFKNTSRKSLQEFKQEYKEEKQLIKGRVSISTEHSHLPSLIFDSKVVRKFMTQKQLRNQQKNLKGGSTETRRILQNLGKIGL